MVTFVYSTNICFQVPWYSRISHTQSSYRYKLDTIPAFIEIDHRLFACVPPKFIFWNLVPNGIRKYGLWKVIYHEGGALVNGVSAFLRDPKSSLIPCATREPSEKTALWTKKQVYSHTTLNVPDLIWTKKQALTRHWISWQLHLRLHNP